MFAIARPITLVKIPEGRRSGTRHAFIKLALAWCGAVIAFTSALAQTCRADTFTSLLSCFGSPGSSLIQASDGNLYGTTSEGGANGEGTVFKITTGGILTTLYSFSSFNYFTNSDGGQPNSLIQANDSNLYGTALEGGVNGWGTVFKITTDGIFTTLYRFSDSDGANPTAGLLQTNDGNLYGTTTGGGAYGQGTIFQVNIGVLPLYRLYNPALGWSLLTASQAEHDTLLSGGWISEGDIGQVLDNSNDAPNLVPLYRLFLLATGDHFYTTSAAESSAAQSIGYTLEGVSGSVFAAPAPNAKPLYRLFNPITGRHLFTADPGEYNDSLAPWHLEGIAAYTW